MNWLLCFLIFGPLCAQTVSLGAVELRLGMTRDAVLSKFAVASNTKLDALGSDWYAVTVKRLDTWELEGTLTFDSGKLTRVALEDYESQDKHAGELAKALYNAVASAETSGLVDVWTGRNNDAKNPTYEVHLVFKDREVVVATSVSSGDTQNRP